MPVKVFKKRLDECGQVGLCVKIDTRFTGPYSVFDAYADVLNPHAHRWEELRFYQVSGYEEAKLAYDKLKSLNLPRLERLVLWARIWNSRGNTYSTWTMPNLRRIVFRGDVPLDLPGKADLLECDIVLKGERIPFTPEINNFLGSTTSLTTLRLTYSGDAFEYINYSNRDIRLPNLRTFIAELQIGFDSDDKDVSNSDQAVLNLMYLIDAPQLEELSVMLRQADLSYLGFLNRLLRTYGKTSSLQTFTFTQVPESYGSLIYDALDVDNPLNGNIVISGLCIPFRTDLLFPNHQGGTYGLRTLTFKNCHLSKAEFGSLLKLYTTKEWYPNFEGIILEQCKGVAREVLGGIVHSECVFIRDG
jgi:hypothetical protein